MSNNVLNTVVSALVGGAVGAAVIFFGTGKTEFTKLKVAELTITKQATLLNAEGKDDLVLKDGSILANKLVVGNKFVGQQYQGNVFIGNRMFTSPDNLIQTPMEQWRFFTEIGSTLDAGGEMIVRSPSGGNVVNKPVNDGVLFRAGFDKTDRLQLFAQANHDKTILPVVFANPASKPANKEGQHTEGAAAAPGQSSTNIATQPDAGQPVR